MSGWWNKLMAGFSGADNASARNTLFPPDDPSQIWRSDNPVGTETVQSLGMPQPTVYAGPVGQFVDPNTGQLTTQGQARMDNPMMGFDTGGIGGVLKGFHGSPHAFDRFSNEAIGTGEGAQAYGYGHYLADSEGVARNYRDKLAPAVPVVRSDYGLSPSATDWVNNLFKGGQHTADDIIDLAKKAQINGADTPAFANAVRGAEIFARPTGHMYEVNVNAEPEHFLDWDKSLSEQHPKVIEALNKTPYPPPDMRMPVKQYLAELETNREMATREGDPAALAAQTLHQAGIPGIRYLDAGSRGKGEGSRNTVVFDPTSMEVIRRYGLAGLMAGGGAAALGGQGGGTEQ